MLVLLRSEQVFLLQLKEPLDRAPTQHTISCRSPLLDDKHLKHLLQIFRNCLCLTCCRVNLWVSCEPWRKVAAVRLALQRLNV